MTNPNNWAIPTEAKDFFQQSEKRLSMTERRPPVSRASDLLGPLAGPQAVLVEDLDSDFAAFNGWITVQPGAIGSPDNTKWWTGWVSAGAEGGTQLLTTVKTPDQPHSVMIRSWSVLATSAARTYSPWEPVGPPPPTPATQTVRYNKILKANSTQNLASAASHSKIILNDTSGTIGPDVDPANSRIFAAFTGLYQIDFFMDHPDATSPAGTRSFNPYVNGSGGEFQRLPGSWATTSVMRPSTLAVLNAGDYVEFWYFQNGGSARDINRASLSLTFLGALA